MCTLPANVLDFVPGEFGFKAAAGQSNDPETLFGVVLQNLCKIFWYCKCVSDKVCERENLNLKASLIRYENPKR